jgi:CRP/FNR family transcriptional regulator, cyclic AMP receptor protein
MKNSREKIGEIPIFSRLTAQDQAKLLDKMEECSFSAGAIIFSQGDHSDAFYFIELGAVHVEVKNAAGRAEAVSELGPQDWFGEMGLVTGPFRNRDYGQETVLWKLSRGAWDEVIKPRLS